MKKTLGQRIRELRQEKDLSLRYLGDLLKDAETKVAVSAAFLSDLENGRRFPSEEMIGKLALALGTTEDELQEHDQRGAGRDPLLEAGLRQLLGQALPQGVPENCGVGGSHE